jgi:HK97 family phage portal protein
MSFLAKLFATSGSDAVSSDNHWMFRTFSPTHAGTRVGEHNAMTLPVVYSAVGIIADSVAQLPIAVMWAADGKREERRDHAASQVLSNRPNPYMMPFTLRGTIQSHALLWGNGYMEIQRDGAGRPIGLWPLLPDRTDRWSPNPAEGYRTTINGSMEHLPVENVVHIPALGFDGLRGYSPVWMARQAVGLGLALEEFAGKFFANDAKSGGFLEHPAKLSEEAKEKIIESMDRQGGLTNAHRMKVLEEGMKFHQTTIPPEDAQFLESRNFQIEEIARLYRVPLHMLMNQSKDTAWGSGIAQMMLGFLTFTLAPWIIRWEQELSAKLLTAKEIADGYYLKFNVSALLRGDATARQAFYTAALSPQTGWMSRNEVRALEDLNPDDVQNQTTSAAKPGDFGTTSSPTESPMMPGNEMSR